MKTRIAALLLSALVIGVTTGYEECSCKLGELR